MIDLDALCSRTLRDDPAVTAIVGDRCWLTMPREPAFPAVLVRRIAGAPTPSWQGPILYDDGDFDFHCYGGSRVEALALAQAVLAALATGLGARPYNVLHLTDAELPQEGGRDRERYIVSATIVATEAVS
jgi:hypothetical protein